MIIILYFSYMERMSLAPSETFQQGEQEQEQEQEQSHFYINCVLYVQEVLT